MSKVFDRPRRGLGAADALKKWSDVEQFARLIELSGDPESPSGGYASNTIRDDLKLREYTRIRDALEQAFIELLTDGIIIGSGIAPGSVGREPIEPGLWDVLEIDYDLFGDANGEHHEFEKVEFFDLASVPLNVRTIPKWLDDLLGDEGDNAFRHSPDYSHIVLHGISYALSQMWRDIVRVLHSAYLEDRHGWREGKRVLADAGSLQNKMGDVIRDRKDGDAIIESDGKGMYRLRMTPPTEPDRETRPKPPVKKRPLSAA
jgi:hypothetical protein